MIIGVEKKRGGDTRKNFWTEWEEVSRFCGRSLGRSLFRHQGRKIFVAVVAYAAGLFRLPFQVNALSPTLHSPQVG